MIRTPRGTNDILPSDINKWHFLEKSIRRITSIFGYQEIRTPIFESTEVFARSIGDTSDIVNKEMYTFDDRGGNSLTLRPEMTAALVRACIQNSLANRGELERLWYYGPFFRYERPQKGRFRQFHQFGAECLSSSNPESDAEVILLANALINDLGIENYTLNINSLGNENSRDNYRTALVEYFSKYKNELSEDSQRRLASNPMRILDSKDKSDIAIATEAPKIIDSLDFESKNHIDNVVNILTNVGIDFNLLPNLVRGLDYYSHTVFEFQSDVLGSQDSFGGGGRYDGLFEQLGGKHTPAVGFALGIERLILVLESIDEKVYNPDNIDFYVVSNVSQYIVDSIKIAEQLRSQGFSAVTDLQGKSLKSQMKDSNKYNAKFVIILAEKELSENNVILKNMESGNQILISKNETNTISKHLK